MNSPQYKATLGVMFFIYLNLLTIALFIGVLCNVTMPFKLDENGKLDTIGKLAISSFMLLLLFFGYLVFLRDRKFQQIIGTFQNKTPPEHKKGTNRIMLYMFLSFFIPIVICLGHNFLKR